MTNGNSQRSAAQVVDNENTIRQGEVLVVPNKNHEVYRQLSKRRTAVPHGSGVLMAALGRGENGYTTSFPTFVWCRKNRGLVSRIFRELREAREAGTVKLRGQARLFLAVSYGFSPLELILSADSVIVPCDTKALELKMSRSRRQIRRMPTMACVSPSLWR